MRRTSPLIAGGGPAGSAAAILLARGGAQPLLIERSRSAHDIVCGGFLGVDAIGLLKRLGLDAFALGGHRIDCVRIVAGRHIAEAALPFAAAGLSRRTLDAALIRRAEQEGAGIERGVTIRHIDRGERRIDLADGGAIESETLFLATGKHDVRGISRPIAAAGVDPAIGLRTSLGVSQALKQALSGTIELHVFGHGYAGLLLQEDGSANLCLSVAQSRLREAGGQPDKLMAALAAEAPHLADRFGAGTPGKWLTIARIPYGWRARETTDGIFRLGDQAAVIASLAGDGVAIALASGQAAARAWMDGGAAAASGYQAGFDRQTRRPIGIAGLIRGAGENAMLAGPLVSLLSHAPSLIRLAASATRIVRP
jgi:flavin-dependent dehydrogenase